MQQTTTTVAQAFRKARVRAGLSVAELSELSNITVQTIYKIENGVHSRPRMETARAIAAATETKVEDLLLVEDAA